MFHGNVIASLLYDILQINYVIRSGIPPTSGEVPPTSGYFDWLVLDPSQMYNLSRPTGVCAKG